MNQFTGSGLLTISAGTLKLAQANVISDNIAVTINSGVIFDLNGKAETIDALNGSGTTDGGGSVTFSIGANNGSGTFSGIIENTAGSTAVTKLGTTVVFYVDGMAYPAPPYNTTFNFATAAAIGARGDNLANSFLGTIDEVSVYSRSLSALEIQGIYSAGGSGKCLTAIRFHHKVQLKDL